MSQAKTSNSIKPATAHAHNAGKVDLSSSKFLGLHGITLSSVPVGFSVPQAIELHKSAIANLRKAKTADARTLAHHALMAVVLAATATKAERRALAAYLESCPPQQWPSLTTNTGAMIRAGYVATARRAAGV